MHDKIAKKMKKTELEASERASNKWKSLNNVSELVKISISVCAFEFLTLFLTGTRFLFSSKIFQIKPLKNESLLFLDDFILFLKNGFHFSR